MRLKDELGERERGREGERKGGRERASEGLIGLDAEWNAAWDVETAGVHACARRTRQTGISRGGSGVSPPKWALPFAFVAVPLPLPFPLLAVPR